MRKSWVFWLANYAAGIVAALSLGLVVLLIVAWVNVLTSHAILGAVLTVLSASIIAMRFMPFLTFGKGRTIGANRSLKNLWPVCSGK